MVKKDSKKSNKIQKMPARLVGKIREDIAILDTEIKSDITPAIMASFGFIIALVWRDAIKEALDKTLDNFGLSEQAYLYNFLSAILVTLVVVGIMILVSRYGKSKKEEKIKKIMEERKKSDEKMLENKNEKK